MNPSAVTGQSNISRRYSYDDETLLVVDTGLPDDAITVDVVDETAIVVLEGEDVTEHEFTLPTGTVDVFINNGVLTFEVNE